MITRNPPSLKQKRKKTEKFFYSNGKQLPKIQKKRKANYNSYKDQPAKILVRVCTENYKVFDCKKEKIIEQQFVQQEELETVFNQLVEQWKRETRGISSSTELILHPAYQQIIGMGKDVIPLLLRELEKKSGRWFWALKSITREDPVPQDKKGKTQAMIDIWLDWGKHKGYQW